MTSRHRKLKSANGSAKRTSVNKQKRKHLLETLEARQLLAGPQLIGIQPNEGDLIVNGSVRDSAPQTLTFRFDEVQNLDPLTFDGVRITRAGDDGILETADDLEIQPGLVTLGDRANNELVVRFAEPLPNDKYKAEVFGFDDAGLGITGLRNTDGELFQASTSGQRAEVTRFELRLGALIEAVVPQPVIRNEDGSLSQNRNEIVVYFNEDPLFTEDTIATGAIEIGGNRISVTAQISDRVEKSFDDVRIEFEPRASVSGASASFDEVNRILKVVHPTTTSYLSIASAINNLDEFEAAITAGSPNTPFVPPADPNIRFLIEGQPSERSVEHPRFYQLLLTQDTVRTTDDDLISPEKVVYDDQTHTARLFFASDINELTPSSSGGTFRLRIGTAVDNPVDLILEPSSLIVHPLVSTDFGIEGLRLSFIDRGVGESSIGRTVRFIDSGAGGLLASVDGSDNIIFDFGGDSPTIGQLQNAALIETDVDTRIRVRVEYEGPGDGTSFAVPRNVIGATPLTLVAVGDTLSTAFDVGLFREADGIQSLVLTEEITALPVRSDVDLYRFEVSLADRDRLGTLTAETFAERLDDASLLDTTLTLFEEVSASAASDFGRGVPLSIQFKAIAPGQAGNNARIDFVLTNRVAGDNGVIIRQVFDTQNNVIPNVIEVDVPRQAAGAVLTAGDLITAINSSPISSTIFRASLAAGDASDSILESELSQPSVVLSGGGVRQLSRNDDYFSEDSRLIADLDNGVYFVGVAASGNNTYDPTIAGTGFGGQSTGQYELSLKFEPRVDEADAIRDLDDPRTGVPGTILDGDGDGAPGGVHNFWFQTRPLDRILQFTQSGASVREGQTLRIVSATGITRTYEFVPIGGTPRPGNIAVTYNAGTTGTPTPAGSLAQAIRNAINTQAISTGVSVSVAGTQVTFSGEQTLTFSPDFRGGTALGRTIFVDKLGPTQADGSLEFPFNKINANNVASAFGSSLPGDIVRIVGNGGSDLDLSTEDDNFSYQFGIANVGGGILEDGRHMEVPKGVTTMIDAGAAFKLRNARIGVGSSTVEPNRSGGALQVLGTPRLVSLSRQGELIATTLIADEDTTGIGYEDGSVIFTSLRDRQVDAAAAGNSPSAARGDWGGLVFRRDIDAGQGRPDLEDEGIFLQRVNHAEIRYGGSSNILIDANQTLVNPITIDGLRPTVSFNEITFSSDAALSATPTSFAEESYQSPVFQKRGPFTADYDRVGPDIYRNLLLDNSINGMFIRSGTLPDGTPRTLTVSARFDDTDVVHYIASNLIIEGTPGAPIADGVQPSLVNVSSRIIAGGALDSSSSPGNPNYEYRMTFVDANGFESLATADAETYQVEVTSLNASVDLFGLPIVDPNGDFLTRRLFRAVIRDVAGNLIPIGNREYVLVAQLDGSTSTFLDEGTELGQTLDLGRAGIRGRLDASLVLDPNLVVKLRGSRIQVGPGAQLLAEGLQRNPVVLTSSLDDRFGAGGTFDTNDDNATANGATAPQRGDWAGIYAADGANVSLDFTTVAYGGGLSLLEGSSTLAIAPLELHGATARVTNSRFEFNESGQGGSGDPALGGLDPNLPSVIFVFDSQPIIVGNEFVDNRGSVVSIDNASLTSTSNTDFGRQTGDSDLITGLDDNRGPLIRRNAFDIVPADDPDARQISAVNIVGGGVLTEALVFDDTDIVHLVSQSLVVGNQSAGGGLRLVSRADESLVVKLRGSGNPNSPTDGTGITATGSPSNDPNRIGGSVQIIGRPGAPVVLTSFADDTVGAGRRVNGQQFTDSNGDSFGSRPTPNDWRSILIDQYSNDRNVDVVLERELPTDVAPGSNGDVNRAESLGQLAPSQFEGDESRRLGFEIEGFLSEATDIDTYTFNGVPGSEVWIDVDGTEFSLDTVIELLDSNGNVLARSDNSAAEVAGTESITILNASLEGLAVPLATGVFADPTDTGSTNPLDAGIHYRLPGVVTPQNPTSAYFFRIRSASTDPNDANGGLTSGAYKVQVRLQQAQEFPGSVVRHADIRYANHGVHVRGLPGSSPLLGEAQENESVTTPTNVDLQFGGELSEAQNSPFTQSASIYGSNNQILPVNAFTDSELPFARPQNLGNLLFNKNNVISVGGELASSFFSSSDIDFYQVDINPTFFSTGQLPSTVFDIDYADGLTARPDTRLSVFYDEDGEGGPIPARLVYIGSGSNISEDQPSPGTGNLLLEQLDRGSLTTNDPFIGPIALNEGVYFVAVTHENTVPTELLTEPLLRLEPIDSIDRIVEDRIDTNSPVTSVQISELFADSVIVGSEFEVTNARANELGHGNPRDITLSAARIFESSLPGGDIGDSLLGAFDVRSVGFSTVFDQDIGVSANVVFSPVSGSVVTPVNSSLTIPHVSISGSLDTIADVADVFSFDITAPGTQVVFDIDDGFDTSIGPYDTDTGTPFIGNFVPSIDLDFALINRATGAITLTTDSLAEDGAFGSTSPSTFDPTFGGNNPDSPDPFFESTLGPGAYAVVVFPTGSTVVYDVATSSVTVTPDSIVENNYYQSGDYILHVSIDDGVIPPPGITTNNSLYYNPIAAAGDGQIVSEPFDLRNYSAGDQPNFYFNYFYAPGTGDQVTYTIFSTDDAGNTTDTIAGGVEIFGDSSWRQAIVDLSAMAGQERVQIQFDYARGGTTGEGLYLDDFVVGFAERGEEVFFANVGEDSFANIGSTSAGKYQLEVRRSTEYATALSGTRTLVNSFDTNARHEEAITIVAPTGQQVVDATGVATDGLIFQISDATVTQDFQFVIDGVGGTQFDAIPVQISATDTSAQVGDSIRRAIGLASLLNIEAATSTGSDDGSSNDNRINLFGAQGGSFTRVDALRDGPSETTALATNGGTVLLTAAVFTGTGDENYLRTQGQVIIEQNRVSDARAIGIWNEAGDRDTDYEDLRSVGDSTTVDPEAVAFTLNPLPPSLPDTRDQFFGFFSGGINPWLNLPEVGNPAQGAIRNLPGNNDSVLGGVAPGVVIRNNVIDQAGFSGIKVDGDARPIVITSATEWINASFIPDGYVFAIDAGGTRVVFEFEDVGGADLDVFGSNQVGGNGYHDGHVPVFYRHVAGVSYNSTDVDAGDDPRFQPYSSIELMTAIQTAIQGSILVTNGLVELVDTAIGVDPFQRNRSLEEAAFTVTIDDTEVFRNANAAAFPNAAVYIYGASAIYDSGRFLRPATQQTPNGSDFLRFSLAPISDAVQPVAQIVNNTIYGADGIEAQFPESANQESNDLIIDAIDTKVGRAHAGAYVQTASLEPVTNGVPNSDVDFYKVELVVGDRLIIDIDTAPDDVDTVVQLFNIDGVRQEIGVDGQGNPVTFVEDGTAPDHLDPLSHPETPVSDFVDPNDDDPFVDFTATETGTYYVAVSSTGHIDFSPNVLAGRSGGTSVPGDYTIGLQTYAPRSFVMSLDNGFELNGATAGPLTDAGTKALDVIGATFTVTQIPDFPNGVPNQVGGPAATIGNQITFEFTDLIGNRLILPNGNINVPLYTGPSREEGYRVPSIMRAIQEAVRGLQDPIGGFDIPTIPNHEDANGPFGRSGPIRRATATALGGVSGDNNGITNLQRPSPLRHYTSGFLSDFERGFGHDRREDIEEREANIIPDGTLTDGDGSTELYVLWENIAEIQLSPEAIAVGLKLTPDNTRVNYNYTPPVPSEGFSQESDQLIIENGILASIGASPTILNNIVVNAHESIVKEETSYFGFGDRVRNSPSFDANIKQSEVVLVGNTFQFDEPRNNLIRYDVTFNIELENPFDVVDLKTSTDDVVGGSNIVSDSSDFNFVVQPDGILLRNPGGNDFSPDINSIVIDSSISELVSRDSLNAALQSVGIRASNVVAPSRDVNGVLRADEPTVAPPGGIGGDPFIDRGAIELADDRGPVAVFDFPKDNDSTGFDKDSAVSFLKLTDGTYTEFRVQLQDNGNASEPFIGSGIDDTTVTVPVIDGLRKAGANVSLFEDGRLLSEGIDYTFSYDESRNVVTLRPLAGIWRDERSYRIMLNNQDRSVLLVPDSSSVQDGGQVTITDNRGGTLVFEFEAGFSLLVPEALTLVVPEVGTNSGGISDGDIFRIDDGVNPSVVFEFNSDSNRLPGTVEVLLDAGPTPSDPNALDTFLRAITANIAAAIQSQVEAGLLDVDVDVDGLKVILGANRNAIANTSGSGLLQPERTLALQVPPTNVGTTGSILDGDQFVINTGALQRRFEFDTNNLLSLASNVPVTIGPNATPGEVALAVRDAVANAGLGLTPSLIGTTGTAVYLNLPLGGSVTAQGQLDVVGISRTPQDGETLRITPADGGPDEILEINRLDEVDANGDPAVDTPLAPAISIDITRSTTADQLTALIANAMLSLTDISGVGFAGLNSNEIRTIPGGLLSIGGEEGLQLAVMGTSLEVSGNPSVTGASTVEVFGPMLLSLPLLGGQALNSGSVLVIQDNLGNDIVFEFRSTADPLPQRLPTANVINYAPFDTSDTIRDEIVNAINSANIGINALADGPGRLSLGRIVDSRVSLAGGTFGGVTVEGADELTKRRGIVRDQEILTIRQGNTVVNYEFEAANGGGGVAPGNIQVPFTNSSTVGNIASALAAAINNNKNGLNIDAVALQDANGQFTGFVDLNDRPGTVVDVSQAPTLNVSGVAGGATPIRISPTFGPTEIKEALINAINSVNERSGGNVTDLVAEDRGGATFFVSGADSFSGPISNYTLPAISDLAGNPLQPNRDDLTTQFTLLLPGVGLDFGDAPDPASNVAGRYPTRAANDGPRHVASGSVRLGSFIDVDLDGIPVPGADGDDLSISISSTGTLFGTSLEGSAAKIVVQGGSVDSQTRDGDTITINTGVAEATLEFDLDGRFDEDNFAIAPADPTSVSSIIAAIVTAIAQSPLQPASVTSTSATVLVDSDDEDGVDFTSPTNPDGILNASIATPIDVSVTGSGILEAWIDFNADGDFDDPNEQIIPMPGSSFFSDLRSDFCPAGLTGTVSNIFADTGAAVTRTYCIVVPPTAASPSSPIDTFARFRVSHEGGLSPTGLALSGEVEDYLLRLNPGSPPTLTNDQANRAYTVDEDRPLQALDQNGAATSSTSNDDGLLAGVIDPNGDAVEILAADTGERTLFTSAGLAAGVLDLTSDGRFTFEPQPDFNGIVNFTARVTDVKPTDPSSTLINSRPISVSINVVPKNDAPIALVTDVIVTRTIDEDEVQIFDIADNAIVIGGVGQDGLIGAKYAAGPANEGSQPMVIASVSSTAGANLSSRGGILSIINNGTQVRYVPPTDYNGAIPDTFTYVVADVPNDGSPSEQSTKEGTVTISINPVNDPPFVVDDDYVGQEDQRLTIPINGNASNNTIGILDNDLPGPADESNASPPQTIQLVESSFPVDSLNGGTVALKTNSQTGQKELEYTPFGLFSGVDQFTYEVIDNLGAVGTGTVTIDLSSVNNAPRFIGINGNININSIARDEAKTQGEREDFNLDTWFSDPEGDSLTYTAAVNNGSLVDVDLDGSSLRLTFPAFANGTAVLTVSAEDPSGAKHTESINITVNPTPDPPEVVGTLNPLSGNEDQVIVADLGGVFLDRDNEPLTYSVLRLGNIINPTPTQIAADPLVQTIEFIPVGNPTQMRITLKPDQVGAVNIEIAARDGGGQSGGSQVSDSFSLTVNPVDDNPIARDDLYNVAIGSTLQIISPASGLLRNDEDVDGDTIRVILDRVAGLGTTGLTLNDDGTFTYDPPTTFPNDPTRNIVIDDELSFTYLILDSTSLESLTASVTFKFTQSRYQNPLGDLTHDVTADGLVTSLDALRIINLLSRRLNGSSTATSIPVDQIGAPPPDYYDVNGDGRVSALDALVVVNRLREINNQSFEGEWVTPFVSNDAIGSIAASSATSGVVSSGTIGVPTRQIEPVREDLTVTRDKVLDTLLTSGLEISAASHSVAVLVDSTASLGETSLDTSQSTDEVDSIFSKLSSQDDFDGLGDWTPLDLGDLF